MDKTIDIATIADYIMKFKVLNSSKQNFYGLLSLQFYNGDLVLYRVETTYKPKIDVSNVKNNLNIVYAQRRKK